MGAKTRTINALPGFMIKTKEHYVNVNDPKSVESTANLTMI
jgi:hypothetical protein